MTLAIEQTYLNSNTVTEPDCVCDDTTLATLDESDLALTELENTDTPYEETVRLARLAFAAGLVTGPEAFRLISQAYGERSVHGIDEIVARHLGHRVLSHTSSIASSPSAPFRKLIRPLAPVVARLRSDGVAS